MTCSGIGDVVYALQVPTGHSPSVTDAEYLAFYPFIYAGVLLLLRPRLAAVPIPIRLDPLICGLAIAAVAVHSMRARRPGRTPSWSACCIYGATSRCCAVRRHLAISGFAQQISLTDGCRVTGRIRHRRRRPSRRSAAGADRVGTTLDAAWPAAALLLALASWVPTPVPAPKLQRGFGSYAIPVACTVVALCVALIDENSYLATAFATLNLIAAAVRFSLTLRDASMIGKTTGTP
ncbi:hypothetical protein [Mycobacterium tilburgii]|uniref:hypothetical protein n=1 Tax=Mycobacterium tilburgii TaxID=44467 RepID=UPI0011826E72|nr:hypothetical protein [Mycobacterium tilburgii]